MWRGSCHSVTPFLMPLDSAWGLLSYRSHRLGCSPHYRLRCSSASGSPSPFQECVSSAARCSWCLSPDQCKGQNPDIRPQGHVCGHFCVELPAFSRRQQYLQCSHVSPSLQLSADSKIQPELSEKPFPVTMKESQW